MEHKRELPVGMQDFENVRTSGCLYVDKTDYLARITAYRRTYFLSRPRRFGKSLFLSMLKYYFQGRKELFEGLFIATTEKEWKAHPVLYFDFVGCRYDSGNALRQALIDRLSFFERQFGGDPSKEDLGARFNTLIQSAFEKFGGNRVVVLIDEYDKPLLEAPTLEIQDEMRAVLKPFYGVLKGAEQYLRFAMLTGVTKFSKLSIFSDLNQPKDISMDDDYAGICGISETEMKAMFMPEVEALAANQRMSTEAALAELKKQYDGYRFSANAHEGMYNPFSLINALSSRRFGDYWFATGTPTFLIKMVKDAQLDVRIFDRGKQSIVTDSIDDYRTENPDPLPLMYQAGYLTITGYDLELGEYTLGFPNNEVRQGFFKGLLHQYVPLKGDNLTAFASNAFLKDLRAGDLAAFMTRLTAFFAAMPCVLSNKTERDYQTVFYTLLACTGYRIHAEEPTAIGRSDLVIELPDAVYVFELKLTEAGTAADALAQIETKGYAAPYLLSGRKIVKVGAAFDKKKRTIGNWLSAEQKS